MDVSTWPSRAFSTFITIAVAAFCAFGPGTSLFAENPPPLPYVGNTLNLWRFDDTNWLSGRGDPPQSFYGIQNVSEVRGNALQIAGAGPAILQYKEIEPTGRTNIQCDLGTIRFWFRPNNWASSKLGGFGPGAYARLIDMGAWSQNASYGWWSLYLSPAGNHLYFSGQTNGYGADFLSANIQFASNEWHHIALTYTSSNSILYLDGQYTTNGSAPVYWPGATVRATNGFTVGSDLQGQNLAQGVFDELRIYDYSWRAEDVAAFYASDTSQEEGGNGFNLVEPEGGSPLGPESEGLRLLTPQPQGTNLIVSFTGGDPASAYQLFTITNLTTTNAGSRLIDFHPWIYLGTTLPGQTGFLLLDPPRPNSLYILGTMLDSNGNGFSDAYESLLGANGGYGTNLVPFKAFITQPNNFSALP